MRHNKPTPLIQQPDRKVCPVCGHPSYSSAGIHPQCSESQADAPRRVKISADRKKMQLAKQQLAKE